MGYDDEYEEFILKYIADSLKGTIYITRPDKELKVEKWGDDSIAFYDPKTLADFINRSAEDYPADKYILVLWDHGSVFDEDDIPLTKSMLQDPKLAYTSVSIHQIEAGVKNSNIKKLEMIYAGICLSGNIETIDQFSSVANYYLGSANVVPGTGGNYTDFINGFVDGNDFVTATKAYMDETIKIWKDTDNINKNYQDIFLADLGIINPVVESFKKVSDRYIQLYQDNNSIKSALDSLQINGYKECKLWDDSTQKVLRWENYGKFYFYDNGVSNYVYNLYNNPQVDKNSKIHLENYTNTDLYASFEIMNENLKDKELSDNLKEFKDKIEAMVLYRVENCVPKLYKDKYHASIGLKWVTKHRADGYMLASETQVYDANSNLMYLYPKTRFGEQTNWDRYFNIFDVDSEHRLHLYEVNESEPFLIDENI